MTAAPNVDTFNRVYPYGRPADRASASPDRYAYFIRRDGLRWQVWCEHEDGHRDPNGAVAWLALYGVRFWRRINALRVAADMQVAHYQGGYLSDLPLDDGRTCTCHPDDKPPIPCPRRFALSECREAAR